MLVERLLPKLLLAGCKDGAVGILSFIVAALDKQDLAAPKVRLCEVRRVTILADEPIERIESGLWLAVELVRTCKLVQNEIVLRVVRISVEQRLVKVDGVGRAICDRLKILLKLLELASFELQVCQPAHRLCVQQRVVSG